MMISNKALFFGVIFSLVLILFLAFPTRLPFNLDPSLANFHQQQSFIHQENTEEIPIKQAQCDPYLYVSQNLGKGQYLQVSDGFYYEVAPEDIRLAAYWLGPSPITFCISDDSEYPMQITNTYSGTSVKVKLSSYDEVIEKIKQLQAENQANTPMGPEEPQPEQAPMQPQPQPSTPVPAQPANPQPNINKNPVPNPNRPTSPAPMTPAPRNPSIQPRSP